MNKAIFLLLIILVPFVSAEGLQFIAQPNDNQTIFFECLQNNNFINANASYSIFYPNTTTFINNQSLNSYETGKYSDYIIIPETEGIYNVQLYCQYTNISGFTTGVFQVENSATIIEVALDMIFGSFLIFLLGILLFWLGSYSKNVLFFFASGLWFIGSAVSVSFTEVNLPMTAFFLLIGIVAIYHGVGKTVDNKKQQENDKMSRLRDDE